MRPSARWWVRHSSRSCQTGAALEAARGLLQGRVARVLKSRLTPHLVFVHDGLQDEARRLTELIDRVAPDGPLPEPEPESDPQP